MKNIFIFGALDCDPLLDVVLNKPLCLVAAQAHDMVVVGCDEGDHSTLAPQKGAVAVGRVLRNPEPDAVARLGFYTAGLGLSPQDIKIRIDGQHVECVSFCDPSVPDDAAPWSKDLWLERWAEMTVFAATEAMAYFGRFDGRDLARRMPTIRARAASRVAARQKPQAPVNDSTPQAVDVVSHRYPYAEFFSFQEFDLSYQRFDGTMGPVVTRGTLVAQDAVIVLPYDPRRDRVLLVEQFRVGPLARGDQFPWALEPVAGMIDPGETPHQTAHREAREEAGLSLSDLVAVGAGYPSPGNSSDYHHHFIGLCDLPDGVAGLGGLASEAEDIKSHLMTAEQLFELTRQGRVTNAPLMILSLWLELNRNRLAQHA